MAVPKIAAILGVVPSRAAACDSALPRAIRDRQVAIYGEDGAGVQRLYGGSDNAGNAAELLSADEVGGALVGGASLTAESFLAIVVAAGGSVSE